MHRLYYHHPRNREGRLPAQGVVAVHPVHLDLYLLRQHSGVLVSGGFYLVNNDGPGYGWITGQEETYIRLTLKLDRKPCVKAGVHSGAGQECCIRMQVPSEKSTRRASVKIKSTRRPCR